MSEPFDGPTILLKALDGEERFVPVRYFPPEYLVPELRPFAVTVNDNPRYEPIPVRTFRRSGHYSGARWWHVYNEGRSRTPEPVPVYLEQA